jgi:hypothetical protein
LIESKEVIKQIIKRLNDNQHSICLYDSSTGEMIYIDDKLKKQIKAYYQDKMFAVQIKAGEE